MDFAKNLVNVLRRSLEPIYSIVMYSYNKNILEYADIVVTDSNSLILNIRGEIAENL